MRFSDIFAASAVVPLVAAHGGIAGAPKIFGLGKLNSRDARLAARYNVQRDSQLHARQGGNNGRCGAAFGGAICDEGYCCSSEGWCGQGNDYCQAPDCQFQYGPACDANQLPSGGSTRPIARPQLGAVPYGGEGIYDCTEPGTVAITYDDGPYIYTNDVLDQFAAYGMKATFFMTGINIGKGAIDDESKPWPAMIRRMIAEGHQVASHTWSHQDLSAITKEQRIDQMVKNEMAISNIIGKFPTYMRPPYSSCSAGSGCPEDLADLGYVISYFDLDTDDYNNVTPELIQNAKNNYANAINPSNPASDEFLAIAHDIHQQTAQNLTGYMLDLLVSKGYRGVTMGECMGEPEANWYRAGTGRVATSSTPLGTATSTSSSTSSGSSTSSAATATATVPTTDGTCGSTNGGFTCIGFELGECCSQYGWCGNTADHCGTGCQPLFGNCGGSSSSSTSVTATSTSTSSSATSSGSSTSGSATSSSSSTSSAPTSVPTGVVSPDGTCGPANNGYICIGFELGECCSEYGWCGNTADHCGTGCNPLYGNCGGSGSSSSSSAASTTSTSSSSSSSAASSSSSSSSSSASSSSSSSASATSTASSSSSSSAASSSSTGSSSSSVASSTSSSTSASATSTSSSSSAASSSSTSSSSSVASSTSATSSSATSGSATSSSATSSSRASSSSATSSSATTSSRSVSSSAYSSTVHTSSTTASTSTHASSARTSSTCTTSLRTSSTRTTSTRTSSTSSAPSYVPTGIKSPDGTCGGKNKYICIGYKLGECCSEAGYCGSSERHCKAGCNPLFGKCGSSCIKPHRRNDY